MRKSSIVAFAAGPPLVGAVSFANLLLIAWMFSVEDLGRNALFVTLLTMGPLLFSLGLEQAYVREYHNYPDKERLFALCFIPGAILMVCVTGMVSFKGEYLASILYGDPSWLLFACTGGSIVLTFANTFFSNALRMKERGVAFSVSQLLPKITLFCILGTTVILSGAVSFLFLICCHILALGITVIFLSRETWPEWRGVSLSAAVAPELGSLLRFAIPLQISNALFWALTATNVLFLRYYADLEQLGLYAAAAGIAGFGMVIRSMFTIVWMPAVYKWHSQNDVIPKVTATLNPVACIVCALISVAGLLSGGVTWLLPERLWDSRYLIAACLVPPMLYALSEVTVVGIALTRKTHYAIYVASGAALTNAILCVVLIPYYGAGGAAIASAAAFTIFFILRSEFSARIWHKLQLKRIYLAVGMAVVIASLQAATKKHGNELISVSWILQLAGLVFLFKNEFSWLLRWWSTRFQNA